MKSFGIKGYKAFNNKYEFDLAPINLLIGPNGSGKSSLIKSLLLSKGIIEPKKSELFIGVRDFFDNVFKDINEFVFSNRLVNSSDIIGKFRQSDLNYNKAKLDREIELQHVIKLSFFYDSFKLNTGYLIDENGNAILSRIELNSVENDVNVLTILRGFISSKEISRISIRINYKYLNSFVSLFFESQLKDKRFKNDSERFKSAIISGSDLTDEDFIFADKIRREIDEDNDEFKKKYSTSFYDQETIILNPSFTKIVNSDSLELFHCIDKVKDEDLYEVTEFSKKINKIDSDSFKNIEEKLAYINFEFFIENRSFANCINNYFWNKNVDNLQLIDENHNVIFSYEKEENDHIEMEQLIKTTEKYEVLINILLLKNLFQNNSVLNFNLDNILHLPALRVQNSSQQISFFNDDMTKLILKKINDIEFGNLWEAPTKYFIDHWLKEFMISNKIKLNEFASLSKFYDEILRGQNIISHSHGYNQLLPVICSIGLFAERYSISNLDAGTYGNLIATNETGSVFLIEEPEANLHPNFQSKLADLFIDASWKFNHQFIIETHSEYMVRKFQYWVAKGKIDPSIVNIYYFDNKNDDPKLKDVVVKKININKDGSLSEPFGEGFFDEAINLQFELLKIKNKQKN